MTAGLNWFVYETVTKTVVNRFVNYLHHRKMDKRLTFQTKVLRRSECDKDIFFVLA